MYANEAFLSLAFLFHVLIKSRLFPSKLKKSIYSVSSNNCYKYCDANESWLGLIKDFAAIWPCLRFM